MNKVQKLKKINACGILYYKNKTKESKMIVVRDVFYLKFGAAKQALALIEKAKDIMKKDSFMPWRVLTDFTGHSYTLILESEYKNLSNFEAEMQKGFSDKKWQSWYEKFKPLVNSSYREILKVVPQ
jgi:hypothetical protein